jgi:ankyrin repeat protein
MAFLSGVHCLLPVCTGNNCFQTLKAKADPNLAKSSDGTTPLAAAVKAKSESMVKAVVAAGARMDGPGVMGALLVTAAAGGGAVNLVSALLAHGAAPDSATADNGGLTPLLVAAMHGNLQLVDLMLSQGASCNLATTDINATPLFFAAQGGHLHVVQRLVEGGGLVGVPLSSNGATDLWAACWKGHTDVVVFLVEALTGGTSSSGGRVLGQRRTDANEDPTKKEGVEGTSPLQVALQGGHVGCAAALRAAGVEE